MMTAPIQQHRHGRHSRSIRILFLITTTVSSLLAFSNLWRSSSQIFGSSATTTEVDSPRILLMTALNPSNNNDMTTTMISSNPTPPDFDTDTSCALRSRKILLFITTHLSDEHIRYFHCCWPRLMSKSLFLPHIDVLLFLSNATTVPQGTLDHLDNLFRYNPSYRVEVGPTSEIQRIRKIWKQYPKLQRGANLGVARGFVRGWFDDYDWLIRINPDVLIRNSTFLRTIMLQDDADHDDNLIEGIFQPCTPEKVHTDFFAVRPRVLLDHAEHNARRSLMAILASRGLSVSNVTSMPNETSTSATTPTSLQPFANESMIQAARRVWIQQEDAQETQFAEEEVARKEKKKGKQRGHRSKFRGVPKDKHEFDRLYKHSQRNEALELVASAFSSSQSLSLLSSLPVEFPFSKLYKGNHENTATKYFASILNHPSKKVAWVPDTDRSKGHCRIRGASASILHEHDYCLNSSAVCEGLEGFDVT